MGLTSAWSYRHSESEQRKHVRDNARSIEIKLTKEDLAELDREFPPPKSKKSLPML
jgi:diketogulonate reductase-like aldo/keto reductase